MRHNELTLRKTSGQLGNLKRWRLVRRRLAVRAIIGVVQHRPTPRQSRFGHHRGPLIGRMLTHPELQSAKTLSTPIIDLCKRVLGISRVDITKGQDPLSHRVAQPGGILVALHDFLRRRVVASGQVAENNNAPQSKTIQALAQIGRIGKEAPIVCMRIDHAKALQFLDQSHANTSNALRPNIPLLASSGIRAPAKPKRLPCQ